MTNVGAGKFVSHASGKNYVSRCAKFTLGDAAGATSGMQPARRPDANCKAVASSSFRSFVAIEPRRVVFRIAESFATTGKKVAAGDATVSPSNDPAAEVLNGAVSVGRNDVHHTTKRFFAHRRTAINPNSPHEPRLLAALKSAERAIALISARDATGDSRITGKDLMTAPNSYRWRKVTDINREHALFELMDGDTILLDIGLSDDGNLEIAFNHSVAGKIFQVKKLMQLIDEGTALVERDR